MATPSDHASWENQVDTNHSELAQKMVSSRTISQYYLKTLPNRKGSKLIFMLLNLYQT